MYLPVILVSIALVGLAFIFMGIRVLLVKNGEFKGTCANNNPFLQKEGVTCGVCGKTAGEPCDEQKDTQPLVASS
ncbi:hypothetical protein GCM10027275_34280 [Rhabdobacter roseus]|uniref:Membrane or secreted protein n=1 Tax=Rhabdobacter roseus TaxID=1655419 RepID=A0A840TZM0_9BACT|nr:hypothetical protein [Rhabdobacter roseus]MBB5285350.1 hypothetical protein [Rhabdobacter roseus]